MLKARIRKLRTTIGAHVALSAARVIMPREAWELWAEALDTGMMEVGGRLVREHLEKFDSEEVDRMIREAMKAAAEHEGTQGEQ